MTPNPAAKVARAAGVSRWTVSALFLIGMFVILLLALRAESNTRGVHANADNLAASQYRQCEATRAQLAKFNDLRRDVIAIERADPDSRSPQRIDAYTRSLMDLPACTPPPAR